MIAPSLYLTLNAMDDDYQKALFDPALGDYDPYLPVWPFASRSLLTTSELRLFALLEQALPEYRIFVQIPLSQMLRVLPGHHPHKWNNRINRMSVDFVVADDSTRIIAAIELDDPSHDNDKRRADDAKKDKALRSANIRIIRWRVEHLPAAALIRKTVLMESTAGEDRAVANSAPATPTPILSFEPRHRRHPLWLQLSALAGLVLIVVLAGRFLLAMPARLSAAVVPPATSTPEQSPAMPQPLMPPDAAPPAPANAPAENTSPADIPAPPVATPYHEWSGSTVSSPPIEPQADECRSWRNSQLLEPTPEKAEFLREHCTHSSTTPP